MSTHRFASYTATVAGALICALALAACSGNPATDESPATETPPSTSTTVDQQPTTTADTTPTSDPPSKSTTASPTSSETSTPTSTGLIDTTSQDDESISPKEAEDREAAERAWIEYNDEALKLWEMPETVWSEFYGAHTTEPLRSEAEKNLREFVDSGKGNWGAPTHSLYWIEDIDGGLEANLMDCIDASNMGTVDAETGKKLSRGVEHNNTHIYLVRFPDGTWKVADVTYLPNLACPGADKTANEEKAALEASMTTADDQS